MTNLGARSPERIGSGELSALNNWFGVGSEPIVHANKYSHGVRTHDHPHPQPTPHHLEENSDHEHRHHR